MKIYRSIPLLFLFLLSGCSNAIFQPPSPTLQENIMPTIIHSPTRTSTITPTLPTPTFTSTPTLIYSDTTPTIQSLDEPSGTPGSIFSPSPTSTETPPVITIPQDSLFTSIDISGDQIFWGVCAPSFVKITTHIDNLSNIHTVTLWLRLENKSTGDTTEWGGGAIMNNEDQGNFTYTLSAKSFSHYREYLNAWGQYQLVASDIHLKRVGASSQYKNNLTIAPCP